MAEIVYVGYNNALSLIVKIEEAVLTPAQMSAITKVGIVYNNVLYESTQYPGAFDTESRASEGVLVLRLGNIPNLPAGRDRETELILWANDYPNGIVWGTLDIKVVDLGV